ncbi:MAG: hypothetical protein LBH59_11225 [Planctomycetaceae bacterium]|jgi:hypothetical protein|nr:hypothetical protein [Planctomycetaceae bacterium]
MAKKVEFNLELVKKFNFWILVPLALLLVFIFNFIAMGAIGKKFTDRKNSLESTRNKTEKIRQESAHPNNNTIDDITVRTEELRGRFVTAWATLEKDQRAKNVWSIEAGPTFIEEVSTLKFGDSISAKSIEYYFNFMNKHIPKLEARLDRRRIQVNEGGVWKDKVGAGTDTINSFSGRTTQRTLSANNLEREVGVVEWPNPEIRNIVIWETSPTSTDVWYAQEDLWVYESLILVIEKSNDGASSPHSAVVKRIESMLIGQQASRELAQQLSVQLISTGETAGTSGMPTPPPPPPPSRTSPSARTPSIGMVAGAQMTDEEVAKARRHERYVDANNVPLPADAPSPFGEFNRMPICLRLIVDRQRIPDILVHCANSPMPIDVLSVRINPGGSSLRTSNSNQQRSTTSPNAPTMPTADSSRQVTMDGSSGLDSIYGSNAVPIEIYGCINIFNPVDQNIIKSTQSETP